MRRCLVFFFFFFLSGCVYYGDIRGHARQLTTAELSHPHVYQAHQQASNTTLPGWWQRFHDPLLNELISTALIGSPNMKIAENRVRRANYLVDGSASSLWPTVNLQSLLMRQRFAEFGLAPPPFNGRTFNIGILGLSFKYEFDFWGKNRETLASKISEHCLALAEYRQAQLILSTAIAETYFQLRGNLTQLRIASANAQQTQTIADIVFDRSKSGIDSDIPVKTALANAQNAKLSMEQVKRSVSLAQHQLAALLGDNALNTTIITTRLSYQPKNLALAKRLPANLLAFRPDIMAARERVCVAAHRINVAKANFFPNINLLGLFSYQSVLMNRLFEPRSQNNFIGGALDLPIFDAGLRRANLGVNYAEYDLAVNEYNKTILTALREVADQLTTLQSIKHELTTQSLAVNATRRNVRLFDARYRHGIIDYAQVLEVKNLLLQYRAQQANLETQHVIATIQMLKTLGGYDTPRVSYD